jgi:diadenosine tetraphosphate (Ap4A) HIT family hydrolase
MTAPSVPMQAFLDRLEGIRSGRHPAAVAKLASGWVVLGDWQHLPGYCQLIADPVVAHLNELPAPARQRFLKDAALVGDALLAITNALRVNYLILGNLCPALHAHIIPRYAWEQPASLTGPNALYFQGSGPKFSESEHGELRQKLAQALQARQA